ncbi:MAG: NAD-dependent epimerase/dehydratase family protein [Candidatus Portnoybacteria bacterium]
MQKKQNINILVTGATGFIGSHLRKELIKKRYNVFLFKGDIRNLGLLKRTIKKHQIKIIFHLAAALSHGDNLNDPFLLFDVNARGTLNLLNAAYLNKVKKFIYISSSSVYSEPPEYLPVDESHPTCPSTIYGISKLEGELYCNVYSKVMNVTVLRYCGAYGKGQDEHYATYRFVKQALKNEPITIYGDGKQSSDFTYVGDIVRGTILAMEKNKPGIYNISSGKEASIRELAENIIGITGSKSKIILTGKNTDRPFRFVQDIKKARKTFGYSPLSLKEGLSKYISEIE